MSFYISSNSSSKDEISGEEQIASWNFSALDTNKNKVNVKNKFCNLIQLNTCFKIFIKYRYLIHLIYLLTILTIIYY